MPWPWRSASMSVVTIQPTHCDRLAYVYVRQSTPWQVLENRESTERQYQLQARAIALGRSPTRVEIIDEDQGRSGSRAAHRTGFQRLVSEVGLGRVGIVLMLEASRLARNNSDWYRLIEICGVSATLIADEGAVYNPRDPNDRLLLGVKGTISEAELFTLRTRLYEGRWNKARKGRLVFPLPTGYVLGPDGQWEFDPDVQVRERLGYVFELFRREGVARRVVRDLKADALELPARVMAKEGYGTLMWKAPTLSTVIRILQNPAYAGAYVYGRWDYSGDRRSSKTGKHVPHLRPVAQWPVHLDAHHPGYLTWQAFLEAVSSESLPIAMQVLDQIEHDLADQRRQRELQLEQARYDARLAQRQYERVDPDNRLVASELERRWNEKLERVAQLEQADAKADADAQWDLTPAERTSITALSQDLPAIWAAPTTTNQDRKQLLRSAIDTVQLDGVSHVGQIEVQIRWRSAVITRLIVERYRRGADSLKTPVDAVERIHELAPMHTYAEIAAQLNADGWRTAQDRKSVV